MKRVLIITYYWPPNGGAGVQRWLKFAKYLPENGWRPVVYTPLDPEVMVFDEGLLEEVSAEAEVIKRPIREPYTLYKKFTGRRSNEQLHTAFLQEDEKRGWREDLALWLRSNLFIPDARVGWVKPSVKYLSNYLKEEPVDAVVTTGPPHSMHLIGLGLKRKLNIKWIADFRDPWTNIDFYHQLALTKLSDKKHHDLQKQVLIEADRVVTIGPTLANELTELGAEKVAVVMNGHDVDLSSMDTDPAVRHFSLVHVGSLSATRDTPGLWLALKELCDASNEFDQKLRLRFVGPVDHSVLRSIRAAGLESKVERAGQIPHAEALHEMRLAGVLLLSLNTTANAKGILTSKLFEYLAAGRPILAIGAKDGDVANVLKAPNLLVARGEENAHLKQIAALFSKMGDTGVSADQHSRRNRCQQLVEEVLDPLVKD